MRRESSAENITHGSTEVNKQPTTRSRKRPLSEINANTGLPSIGVENVSSAQQPSVDCDDSTSMQGESSHSGVRLILTLHYYCIILCDVSFDRGASSRHLLLFEVDLELTLVHMLVLLFNRPLQLVFHCMNQGDKCFLPPTI